MPNQHLNYLEPVNNLTMHMPYYLISDKIALQNLVETLTPCERPPTVNKFHRTKC